MSNLEIACNDVQQTIFLFIDHELPSEEHYPIFEIHFQQCPPCHELLEHERAALIMMQNLLRGTCNESAPQELHDRIRATIDGLGNTTAVEFFSQTTYTEITFDGTTSISVTQEFTQEIRHEFPNE
jgi:mycothiol system anti-sigma-R factor